MGKKHFLPGPLPKGVKGKAVTMAERKYLRHPEKRPDPQKKRKIGQVPIIDALKFQEALQTDCQNQGDVARKFNLPHRAKVSTYLQLLQLPQVIIDYLIEHQHHKGVRRIMTANRLRRFLLKTDNPLQAFKESVRSFRLPRM